MLLANAPTTEPASSWDVRQIPALSLRVADAVRDWAIEASAAGDGQNLRPDGLHGIIALVDAYAWQCDPSLASADFSSEGTAAAKCGAGRLLPIACGHSERVARLATRIAEQLGWRSRQLTTMYLAGLLHDVGKVGVDARILHKPGKLTESEYRQISTHPEVGYRMLLGIEPLAGVLPAVLYHHEQWNGGGYPHGLSGEEIPPIARIVAVADAHDAMSSDRPYRDGMPKAEVRRVFEDGTATYWDPTVVKAYYRAIAG